MEKTFHVVIDCANCAQKIEDALNQLEPIASARMNFLAEKLTLQYDEAREREVLRLVKKTCRKIEPDCEIDF